MSDFALSSSAQTEIVGAVLARSCGWSSSEPRVVFLQGELGAGKTTLARGLLRAVGVAGPVRSPSYALIETYAVAAGLVVHADLYRLHAGDELEELGLRDYFRGGTLLLIEWPQRASGGLPTPDLSVMLEFAGEGRVCRLAAFSDAGLAWLRAAEPELSNQISN